MSPGNRDRARKYRNNSTKPEVLLWNYLKHDQLGYNFRRQFCFDNFILDFYCSNPRVNIEVDGKIHVLKQREDRARDAALSAKGVTVLRFSAQSVLKDPESVAYQIKDILDQMTESTSEDASPDGEAGK